MEEFIVSVLYFVGVGLGYAVAIMYLWNDVMVDLFNLPAITYTDALSIVLLSYFLFKAELNFS